MENKLFIALDIDGVLNSNQDHLKLAKLQQEKDIIGMVEALQNEIKFSKTTKGGLCYGNFVNRHQLKLLNDFINKYLDDLRHDNIELFNQQLSNFKKRNPNIQWFYPKITERFGLQKDDLDLDVNV